MFTKQVQRDTEISRFLNFVTSQGISVCSVGLVLKLLSYSRVYGCWYKGETIELILGSFLYSTYLNIFCIYVYSVDL